MNHAPRFLLLLAFALLSCDTTSVAPTEEADGRPYAVEAVGDRVVTLVDATSYSRPGNPDGGVVPAGNEGTVEREKNQWTRVLFDDAGIGSVIVLAETLGPADGDPPPPPPPPPPGDVGHVVVMGCSNSKQMAQGAASLGADVSHPEPMNKGSLGGWGNPGAGSRYSKLWSDLSAAVTAQTTHVVWEICTGLRDGFSGFVPSATEIGWAGHVVDRFQSEYPSVTFVVSGLNLYVPGHVCSQTGLGGPERANAIADIVATGSVLRGPVTGPFGGSQLDNDGCHLSAIGKTNKGQQLIDYLEATP